MLHATLKSLLAHKMRMAMSAFAIVLGVAFVVGTLVFSDTLNSSFKDLFRQTAPDVMVRPANAGAASAGGFTSAGTRSVDADVVALLEAVPGVGRADGAINNQGTLVIGKDGKAVSSGGGTPGVAGNYNDGPAADGSPIVAVTSGRAPTGPGELLIDDKTAETAGYVIGDAVHLVTSGAQPQFIGTMVGTLRFGESGNLVGATLVLMDTPTAQELYLGGADVFSQIAVTGDGSMSNQQLREAVTGALPAGLEAVDDEQIATENQTQIQGQLGIFTTFLLVFAAVSLVVGTFLILNTFSIVVAQRTRELALFRALGASRRQVTRSVLIEALIIGVIGSTVGLVLGFGLALGLKALFAAVGINLTQAGLVFQWRTAVAAYAVGVLVTLVAAYLPAWRAASVPPIAAMRDDVSIPESSMRRRLLGGAAITVAGAVGMAAALWFNAGLPLLGAGVLAVFVGVSLLSPAISRPIVAGISRLYPRLFGTVGTLARENARRNPRRTAATASALMIGLALVTAISILGQSTKSSVDKLLSTDLTADYIVSSAIQSPFSASIADSIAAVPGVQDAVPFRSAVATVNGRQQSVSAFDPAQFSHVVTLSVGAGDLATPENGVLVAMSRANAEGWKLGDTIPIVFPAGPSSMRITAILSDSLVLGSDIVVTAATLTAGGISPVTSVIYITRTVAADPATVSAGIQAVLADLPTVVLQDRAAYAAAQRAPIDSLLGIVYALLGLALIIAVLGIVNTLALSVLERTREVGLLRAVGMSRRQLRSMIRLESAAIAVLGAILGIGLGLIFGISLQRAMSGQGIPVLSIPAGQLAAFVGVAAAVGVLAAALPARRAARMDVLRAISTQ